MLISTMNDVPGWEIEEVLEEAETKGANCVVAFRFDTSELGNTWTEICAYGTAVRARKL